MLHKFYYITSPPHLLSSTRGQQKNVHKRLLYYYKFEEIAHKQKGENRLEVSCLLHTLFNL